MLPDDEKVRHNSRTVGKALTGTTQKGTKS